MRIPQEIVPRKLVHASIRGNKKRKTKKGMEKVVERDLTYKHKRLEDKSSRQKSEKI